jgi:hypothetical protein
LIPFSSRWPGAAAAAFDGVCPAAKSIQQPAVTHILADKQKNWREWRTCATLLLRHLMQIQVT